MKPKHLRRHAASGSRDASSRKPDAAGLAEPSSRKQTTPASGRGNQCAPRGSMMLPLSEEVVWAGGGGIVPACPGLPKGSIELPFAAQTLRSACHKRFKDTGALVAASRLLPAVAPAAETKGAKRVRERRATATVIPKRRIGELLSGRHEPTCHRGTRALPPLRGVCLKRDARSTNSDAASRFLPSAAGGVPV